jgi:arsenite methyltransferase
MMTDRWARWVLAMSAGAVDDPVRFARVREFRDNVLRGARLRPGDVLLDVGCGDGLIGFGALDPLPDPAPAGEVGMVIFSDVSEHLLDRCREIADQLGATDRCRFVHTGLPDLEGIESGSVDVVTTRSVLIYVADKGAAFDALYRVLRPGGRLSIFEPINRFTGGAPQRLLWGFDATGLDEIAGRVRDEYRRHQPDENPMTDFDERDLLRHAEAAGFTDLHLSYEAYIDREPTPMSWPDLLRYAPNPLVPPLGEVIEKALAPAEREALAERFAAEAAAGRWYRRLATAYLTGTREA